MGLGVVGVCSCENNKVAERHRIVDKHTKRERVYKPGSWGSD